MPTQKRVHIVCDNVICRGEYLGHVDVTGIVRQPGECSNYKKLGMAPGSQNYSSDDWYIEMDVIESNCKLIAPGYAELQQINDGFAQAKITFFEVEIIKIEGKSVWVMSEEDADLLLETLNLDSESSSFEFALREQIGNAVNRIESFTNNVGEISIFHKEAK